MKLNPKSLAEIRREGLDALLERLGPAGLFRFLQQFDQGSGDYTRDRQEWIESANLDEIAREMRDRGNGN